MRRAATENGRGETGCIETTYQDYGMRTGTELNPAPPATNSCTIYKIERAALAFCKCNSLGTQRGAQVLGVGLKPLQLTV